MGPPETKITGMFRRGDGIELLGHAAGGFDLAGDQLSHILQVDMSRHKLGKGVGYRDDRLVEVVILHAGGTPQGTGTRHIAAGSGSLGTILRHGAPLGIRFVKIRSSISDKSR